MELAEQHASVVEEVSRADAAVKMADVGPQPSVQLSVDVKLPGIGRLLNLQQQTFTRNTKQKVIFCLMRKTI